MPTTFFSQQRGQVLSFADPAVPAFTSLKLDGWEGFNTFKSILTRVAVNAQTNFQFLHTLGGEIYLYVFGDRMGELIISGLAFDSACGSPGVIGIENVYRYYDAHKLSSRQAPVSVTIGTSTTLKCYLAGISSDVIDAKNRLTQFTLAFTAVPSRAGNGGRRPAAEASEPAAAEGGSGGGGANSGGPTFGGSSQPPDDGGPHMSKLGDGWLTL